MKRVLVFVTLVFMICVCSIHVFASDFLVPAVRLSTATGDPVTVAEYHSSVFDECIYSWCLEITEIDDIDGDFSIVTGTTYPVTSDSFTYQFMAYDYDWVIGDLAAVIMSDNQTPLVYDDTVIAARYIGYVGE